MPRYCKQVQDIHVHVCVLVSGLHLENGGWGEAKSECGKYFVHAKA